MYEIIKHGLIFNPSERLDCPDWMVDYAQAPNAVVLDDKVRIYF